VKYTPTADHPYSLDNFRSRAPIEVGSALAALPLGELRFGVGFGEVDFPVERARELWKKRIEDLSLWRILDVREVEGLAWEVDVNEFEALGDAEERVLLKVL
jgi:hypothetical protein